MPGGIGAPDPQEPDAPPVTARAVTLSVATVATALLVAVAGVLPVPYAVHSPGPTWDTLGEDDGVPLIRVEGAPTFEPTGELRLTTVEVGGGPGYPVSLASAIAAWVDPQRSVAPVETVFSPDEDREVIEERNQAAMISSQEHATVAALEELGYEVPTTLLVESAIEGTGSAGVVEEGDVITAVDGEDVTSFSDLSAVLDEVSPGAEVELAVEREGEPVELEVTTTEQDGKALLGVFIDPEFELPVDVRIQIENVGGPSAGLMFALGIVDVLTEADETGGVTIAGTGTMDLTGAVGPIGGIRQKLYGAREDGATWFLAPEDNCGEVVGHVPDGLSVTSVGTLAQARAAVEAIGRGETEGLPTC
ncbi:PDZ domain-containing protein [Cellulomonas sp. APG4]|nr:PDZ domain-containing protein [Cellulomonas sp. APG4]